jgi:hypothetical protein
LRFVDIADVPKPHFHVVEAERHELVEGNGKGIVAE